LRKAIVVAVFWLLVGGMTNVRAAAPPVKVNAQAASEAMSAFLGTSDSPYIERIVAEERKFLEIGALRSPDEIVASFILLNRGLTGVGLHAMLVPRELTLTGMETKIPLASGAKIETLWIDQQGMLMTNTTVLEEKVDLAIGRERYKLKQRADRFGPGKRGAELTAHIAELREMALSREFAVYRLEVVGRRSALFDLLRDKAVRAVFVTRDSKRAATLLAERQQLQGQIRFLGPAVRMGRIKEESPMSRVTAPPPAPSRASR
jgi:hypothetical protein